MEQDVKPIYKSATKMVFILISIALVVGLFTGHVDKQDFIVIASNMFSFYFGRGMVNTNTMSSTK